MTGDLPEQIPLRPVKCPYCHKTNVTSAKTKRRCSFCRRMFDPMTVEMSPEEKKARRKNRRNQKNV